MEEVGIWNPQRPSVLVIACSDGRFEAQTDRFLRETMGYVGYDRLYLPGGPGSLAGSGFEYARVDVTRKECRFLIVAHQIEEVFLLFHGNSADGPEEAMCADYTRKLSGWSTDRLRAQQETDLLEIKHLVFGGYPNLRIRAYRAEVGADHVVRFVNLQA